MEKKIVQFKGMSNVPDDGFNEAGQMAVMMNARIKNGEMEPVEEDRIVKVDRIGKIKKTAFHHDRLLELDYNGKMFVYPSQDSNYYDEVMSNEFNYFSVDDFAIFGNIVVLFGVAGTTYVLWRNDTYKYLGGLPKPSVNFSVQKDTYLSDALSLSWTEADSNFFKRVRIGHVNKALDYIYEKKGYVDCAIFLCVLNLVDDTKIVCDSAFCELDSDSIGPNNFVIHTSDNKMRAYYFDVYITGGGINDAWKDLVKSVEIYSSGSILSYKEGEVKHTSGELATGSSYKEYTFRDIILKSESDFTGELRDMLFYKIGTMKGGRLEYSVTNTSPSGLAAQEVLYGSDTSYYSMKGYKGFRYNNRMHAYQTKEHLLCNLFPLKRVVTGGNTVYETIYTQVETTNEKSVSDVEKQSFYTTGVAPVIFSATENVETLNILTKEGFLENHEKGDLLTRGLFFKKNGPSYSFTDYPSELGSINTQKVAAGMPTGHYLAKLVTSGGLVYVKGTSLYFSDRLLLGTSSQSIFGQEKTFSVQTVGNLLSGLTPTEFGNADFSTKLKEMESNVKNNVIDDKGVLRVSETDNPFTFNKGETYSFDGDIVAISNNTEDVSLGQFGQYPLYVFTTQGIWALQVDTSGKGAYASLAMVSVETCNGEVCNTNDGVAFISQRGIMVISGKQVKEISEPLDGLQCEMLEHSKTLLSKIAEKGAGIKEYIPIKDYIKGAKLGYSNKTKELLVFNPEFDYSYIYNTINGIWAMQSNSYDVKTEGFTPDGNLVLYKGEDDDRCLFKSGKNIKPILVITRPFTLGAFDFKRIRQAALRTTFKGTLNFYVLGSNDGANFVCITGKEYPSKNGGEPTDVMRRDLVTSMSRSRQYKYFAIAIAGNMEGRISMAELLMDAGFANNQLR